MAKKKAHGGKRPGAGRKPAHPEGLTAPLVASVPVALAAKLDELAEEKGWSRSEAVTQAIRGLLAKNSR